MNVTNLSKHGRHIAADTRAVLEKPSMASKILELPTTSLLKRAHVAPVELDDLPCVNPKAQSTHLMRGHKWKNEKRIIISLILKFWKSFVVAAIFRIVCIFSDFGTILLLKYLVDATETRAQLFTFFVISLLILFFMFLKSIFIGAHNYVVSNDTVRMAAVLGNLIVKKSLSVSCASDAWPTAKISKLISVHSEAVSSSLAFVHNSWSSVIELTVAIVWIWETLGTRTVIGVAFVALLYMALNLIISTYYKKYQRVEAQKEVLSNIDIIKIFTWETPFSQKLKILREKELSYLRSLVFVNRLMHSFNTSAPFLVMVVSFTTYGVVHDIEDLRFEDVFVMIAVFNYMRRPLASISPALHFLNKAFHSATRINEFLNIRQSPNSTTTASKPKSEDGDIEVKINDASFTWNDIDEHLNEINFEVQKGELHAIIGLPSAGKSSLLCSILGELKLTKGVRRVTGKLGYVPSRPFIFSQTVKANILFGKPYEKWRYDKVLTACDLRKDVFDFPRCDATIVGEKGFPLTATQKAQISLARCLYDDPELLVFDKPFSDMDRSTAKKVYQRLFAGDGLLKEKTIVLATNATDFVHSATKIHILEEGRIVKVGSYEEIADHPIFMRLHELNAEEKGLDELTYQATKPSRKTVMFDVEKVSETKRRKSLAPLQMRKRSLYVYYMQCFSFQALCGFLFFITFRYFLQALTFFWIATWLDPKLRETFCTDCDQKIFLYVLALLAFAAVLINAFAYVLSAFGNIKASRKLFADVVDAVFMLPFSYIDINTSEAMTALMTEDLDVADMIFPLYTRFYIETALNIFMVLAIVCINIPFYLVFVVAFLLFYYAVLKFFLPSLHQIQNVEKQVRASLLCFVAQNFTSRMSIRAFGKVRESVLASYDDIDKLTRCRLAQLSAFRWLSLRLELVGNLVLSDLVTSSLRILCQVESSAQSLDRISQAQNLPKEKTVSETERYEKWRPNCAIDVTNLNVFLRKEKHVLKDVTLKIGAGENVGVAGKFGSGKSTFALSLIRITPADDESRVRIDDVDVAKFSTEDLRSRITVIPQKLAIFKGSVRFNIDPSGQFADSDLWYALEACQLKYSVADLTDRLDHVITDNDLTLQQKQQLNVCRGILKGGSVFVFDQSLTSVSTDIRKLIYESISEILCQATIIKMAETVDDVHDCDRIFLFDDGVVVEHDKAAKLHSLQRFCVKRAAQAD